MVGIWINCYFKIFKVWKMAWNNENWNTLNGLISITYQPCFIQNELKCVDDIHTTKWVPKFYMFFGYDINILNNQFKERKLINIIHYLNKWCLQRDICQGAVKGGCGEVHARKVVKHIAPCHGEVPYKTIDRIVWRAYVWNISIL